MEYNLYTMMIHAFQKETNKVLLKQNPKVQSLTQHLNDDPCTSLTVTLR